MDPAARPAPSRDGRLGDLHIRLVGGSLLRRTVLSVAAFTMTTCLLLGLISMAAVGATRAIVGGGDAPADETAVDAAPSEDEAVDGPSSARSPRSSAARDGASRDGASRDGAARGGASRSTASKARSPGRRAGGAVAPDDALRGATEDGS